MNKTEDLTALRAEIDGIDRELTPLLAARMDVSRRIGRWKAENGLPIADAEREAEKCAALSALCPAEGEDVAALYRGIFAVSREAQAAEQDGALVCGLLGEHLSHSYSPAIHAHFGHYPYELQPLSPESVERYVRQGNWTGLNVTVPYKKRAFSLCDECSPLAARLGCVNTLLRRDGKIYGDNTDAYGFASLLSVYGIRPAGRKVLVLGDGGAGKTVAAVLADLGAAVTVLSRRGGNGYDTLPSHRDAELIVNATPVGMYPNNGETLLHPADFPACRWVIDLIYNPARTALLAEAEAAGKIAVNGLWMLVAQAAKSAELFTRRAVPWETVGAAYEAVRLQTQNVLLVGMPGCGKSTVAAELGKRSGRRVEDSDCLYTARFGQTPAAAIAEKGESFFRAGEREILRDLCKASGTVIATGGGSVLLPESEALLRQNSFVVWVRRPLDALARENRPLSGDSAALAALARAREPLYARLSDLTVDNGPEKSPKEVAEEIWTRFRQSVSRFS